MLAAILVLEQYGPTLGRPYRVFFAFDPLRQAVMLCGGDKTGNKHFYETMIPIAEREFLNYLQELE